MSRLAAAASTVLTLLGAFMVWGLARSPDSGWKVGLFVSIPCLSVAAAFGALAYWSRDERAVTTDVRFAGAGLLGLVGLVLVLGLFGAGPFSGFAAPALGIGCAVAAIGLGLSGRPARQGQRLVSALGVLLGVGVVLLVVMAFVRAD